MTASFVSASSLRVFVRIVSLSVSLCIAPSVFAERVALSPIHEPIGGAFSGFTVTSGPIVDDIDPAALREVASTDDELRRFSLSAIRDDDRIRSITVAADSVTLSYASPCRLLFFFPMTCPVQMLVGIDGDPVVTSAWWTIFLADDTGVLRSVATERMTELRREGIVEKLSKQGLPQTLQRIIRTCLTILHERYDEES